MSETFLSELVTAQAYENRHMTMESMYEYGSRAGVWRLIELFDRYGVPVTIFAVHFKSMNTLLRLSPLMLG